MRRFFSTSSSEGLKYFVERTKVGKNLPIYTEYRRGGNVCYTLIKRVSGDAERLFRDLKAHFLNSGFVKEKETNKKKIYDKWRIRGELGHVWVYGKHSEVIRKFLESKGF